MVPVGRLATDDAAAAAERKKLREELLGGSPMTVNSSGQISDPKSKGNPNEPAIQVPPGKLASSFYWYNRDPELFQIEISAMNRFFPQFRHAFLPDGRMHWTGEFSSDNLRRGGRWILDAVYDNNHPHNSSYGGSVKVYSIFPDLDEISAKTGSIPHTLRDSQGHLYLCTARMEDFKAGSNHSHTASTALSFASKWIAAFELWHAGDLSTSEFSDHRI